MTVKKKILFLLISCLLMVFSLCWIQYRLVYNTYDLNTKSYFAEVTRKLNSIDQFFTDSANHRAVKAIMAHVAWYIANRDRTEFLDSVSRVVTLANRQDQQELAVLLYSAFGDSTVKFTMQYASIVLTMNGIKDTLLANTQPPFAILGEHIEENELDIGQGIQTNSFTGNDPGPAGQKTMYTLTISYLKKADVSGWQKQVWKRMAGIFLMAGTLIIGTVVLFYSMFRTLLHQKKMADIQADLTNNITHELRTPLSSMAIIIKSLRRNSVHEQPAMYEELMVSLERQQHKLSHIVDRVLESVLTTDTPLHSERYEINSLVRRIVTDFPMGSHSLKLNIPHDPIWIDTDEYVLGSVIHNLLDNAVKYSDAGKQVEVTGYAENDRYVIAIRDEGNGIARSEQAKIFGKFYRVAEKNLHTVKGMGLGLYLCQVNAKRLNGSLSVESEPSKGSTFTINLSRS